MPIDADRRRKLVGLLGRLGSDNDNERLNAVRLIEAGRKALGMQWEDLIVLPVTIAAHVQGPLDLNGAGRAAVKPSFGKVADLFDTLHEFLQLLMLAEGGACTSKECDFVESIRERADLYRERTFVSEAQLKWLRDLAGRA